MRVVFHDQLLRVYARDPAAEAGRLEPSVQSLSQQLFDFVEPEPVPLDLVAAVHSSSHIESVKRQKKIFPMARLAAGGALLAARMAAEGEAAFALIRPPGHHASQDSSWGFCYFNNIAIAVEAVLAERDELKTACILDIDLHFGDGTSNFCRSRPHIAYVHPSGRDRNEWLRSCEECLDWAGPRDLIAISAGFDRHLEDWGEELLSEDYAVVGRLVRTYAEIHCGGRCFAVLEGGYNAQSMALAAVALTSALDGRSSERSSQ